MLHGYIRCDMVTEDVMWLYHTLFGYMKCSKLIEDIALLYVALLYEMWHCYMHFIIVLL